MKNQEQNNNNELEQYVRVLTDSTFNFIEKTILDVVPKKIIEKHAHEIIISCVSTILVHTAIKMCDFDNRIYQYDKILNNVFNQIRSAAFNEIKGEGCMMQ